MGKTTNKPPLIITKATNGTGWEVKSGPNTYCVRNMTSVDPWIGSLIVHWECTCPAGTYGRSCRHVAAVREAHPPVDEQAGEREIN